MVHEFEREKQGLMREVEGEKRGNKMERTSVKTHLETFQGKLLLFKENVFLFVHLFAFVYDVQF